MAQVFQARRVGAAGFARVVALKRVRTTLAQDEDFKRMLVAEARLAAKLHHPGIAQVHDFVEDDGGAGYALVMEYVDGRTLKQLLQLAAAKGVTLSEGIALHVAAAVAEALHYAHELREGGRPLGIVHRDVSPHNIMVAHSGEVKLLDFGIAYSGLESRERTRAGLLKGKVSYMSPEHALGGPLDGRSDEFSLALVLVEMLTGRRLFDGTNEAQTLQRLVAAAVEELRALTTGLPPTLQAHLARALAKEKEARFPSCGEFADALRAYLASLGRAVGPRQVVEEVARLEGLPDAPASLAGPVDSPPAARRAQPAARSTEATSVLTPPGPAPVPSAPLPPSSSDTQERRRARLAEEIHNPKGATRKAVVLPGALLLVLLLGGSLVVHLWANTTEASHPQLEEVKSPAQQRAEEEAQEHQQQLSAAPPALALLPEAPAPASASPAGPPPAIPAPSPVRALARTAPRHAASTAVAAQASSPPAPVPPPRRSLATSMSTRFASASPAASGGTGVPRGTFLPACLTTPVDPAHSAPFTAAVSADVTVGAALAVPLNSAVVCTAQGVSGSRLTAACDSLTLTGRAAISFSGLVYGRDKRPGLPVTLVGGSTAAADAKDGALTTAERVLGAVAPGGIAGEVLQGAAGIGSHAARGTTYSTEATARVVPSGTCFLIFVNQPF